MRYTLRSDYPKTELGQSTRFSQSHRKIHCSRPLCSTLLLVFSNVCRQSSNKRRLRPATPQDAAKAFIGQDGQLRSSGLQKARPTDQGPRLPPDLPRQCSQRCVVRRGRSVRLGRCMRRARRASGRATSRRAAPRRAPRAPSSSLTTARASPPCS